jgi:8-oxo-dGTP pyrophosphatase MutT (NUDIX family)
MEREGRIYMARRTDYFNDPNAPRPTRIVPAATAIVTNEKGHILVERRRDNAHWGLPGGVMEVGETIGQTIIREVKEETELDVLPITIVGVYTNPNYVIAYADGEVRQQFSICFACTITGGELHVSEESFEVAFFSPEEIEQLTMHESIRLRIHHYLTRQEPAIC